VFDDLKAYSCTFEYCDHGPFGSRTAWAAHERRYHLRLWRCHICKERFDAQDLVISHVNTEHRSIDTAITSALAYAESTEIERLPISQCPFCDDHHMWKSVVEPHASSSLQEIPEHEQAVRDTLVPTALYHRHMSKHMEQLALFSVPSAANDDDNENADGEAISRSSQAASDQSDMAATAFAGQTDRPNNDSALDDVVIAGNDELDPPMQPPVNLQGWSLSDSTSDRTTRSDLNAVPNAVPGVRSTSESLSSSNLGEPSFGKLSATGKDDRMEDLPADATSSDQHEASPHLSSQDRSVNDPEDEHKTTNPKERIVQPESIVEAESSGDDSLLNAPSHSAATRETVAPVTDSSLPVRLSEPDYRVDSSGTAVYALPPSLSERRAYEDLPRTNSFDDVPSHDRPSLSVHSATSRLLHAPRSGASSGLSVLPSLRHRRTDSDHVERCWMRPSFAARKISRLWRPGSLIAKQSEFGLEALSTNRTTMILSV
jgi:hypothetical protein